MRFIGARVIGVGAIWTLATLFMQMVRGLITSFAAFTQSEAGQASTPLTERHMPSRWIFAVTLVLVAVLVCVFALFLKETPILGLNMWVLVSYSVAFAFVFGFLVAAACGYMAGFVSSSTSPISSLDIVALAFGSDHLLGVENGVQLWRFTWLFSRQWWRWR